MPVRDTNGSDAVGEMTMTFSRLVSLMIGLIAGQATSIATRYLLLARLTAWAISAEADRG